MIWLFSKRRNKKNFTNENQCKLGNRVSLSERWDAMRCDTMRTKWTSWAKINNHLIVCYYFLFGDFEWIAVQHFLFTKRIEWNGSWIEVEVRPNAIGNRRRRGRRFRRPYSCCHCIRFEWLIMRIRLNVSECGKRFIPITCSNYKTVDRSGSTAFKSARTVLGCRVARLVFHSLQVVS